MMMCIFHIGFIFLADPTTLQL